MVRSMTAYGRAQVSVQDQGSFTLELTSVNRKNLDLSVYAPKELSRFEIAFRRQIAAKLSRGSVTLRISRASETISLSAHLPKKEDFKLIYDHLAACCEYSGMSRDAITTATVLQSFASGVADPMGEKECELFSKALDEALCELIAMGEKEGQALKKAMLETCAEIEAKVSAINGIKTDAIAHYQEKLKKKIEQFDHGLEDFEERLAREVILFSEKVDIEEELVRLRSHLAQFSSILEGAEDEKKGKKLEFLTQEIHRETNTIASKSQGIEVINLALEIKGLVKTLVEQLQNIV